MITKQMIEEKLGDLTEEELKQIYEVIEQIKLSENTTEKNSLFAQLQKIQIDAPTNFSEQVAISLGRDVNEE